MSFLEYNFLSLWVFVRNLLINNKSYFLEINKHMQIRSVDYNSMADTLIIEKAIEEVETKTLGVTKQFLAIHKLVYIGNLPKIARVDTGKINEVIVYFYVEDEMFFLAVYVDLNPNVSVRWTNTEPYHSIYFSASSETLSFKELSELTILITTKSRNKGDKKHPENEKIVWKQSSVFIEPNPEADRFEDKLTKLLDYLEEDTEGIRKLVNNANGHIQVYSSFHNGNTMIGGHHLEKEHIKRLSKLNLEIDFDISADGNFFA